MSARLWAAILAIALINPAIGRDLLERPVAIGASLTDGFDVSETRALMFRPKSIALRLPTHLETVLELEPGRIQSYGHRLLLANVIESGRLQVDLALADKPSIVFAVDYLFWYVYGAVGKEDDRLARLRLGIKQLERLDCPIIVGNFPDASAAIGRIIHARQMPRAATLEAANAELVEWVVNRENATLIDLANFMKQAASDESITIGDVVVPAGETKDLLQSDRLHPTLAGAKLVAQAVREVMAKSSLSAE